MHGHDRVEVELGRFHLDRNADQLDRPAGVGTNDVATDDPLVSPSTMSLKNARVSRPAKVVFIGRNIRFVDVDL